MTHFLTTITPWHWLVFGLALAIAEIIVPGTFLLWPGLSAIIVGLLNLAAPVDWDVSIVLWAVLSVATVAGFVRYRKAHPTPANTLNQRGVQYIGQRFTVEKPILNGKGELKVDDTIWKAVCDRDLPAGASVKVTAVEGTSLRVEAF